MTRPEPEAADLATRLRDKGLDVAVAPLFQILGIDPGPLGDADALLLTSPRAARFVPRDIAALPVYAVGEATAEAAETNGLKVAGIGPGEADTHLAELLPTGGEVLHLAGEDVARDLTATCSALGIPYRREAIYRAQAEKTLPLNARSFLRTKGQKTVTLLSVRAAEVFAQLVTKAGLKAASAELTAACFSQRIAAAASASLPYRSVGQTEPGNLTRFVDFVSSGGT